MVGKDRGSLFRSRRARVGVKPVAAIGVPRAAVRHWVVHFVLLGQLSVEGGGQRKGALSALCL